MSRYQCGNHTPKPARDHCVPRPVTDPSAYTFVLGCVCPNSHLVVSRVAWVMRRIASWVAAMASWLALLAGVHMRESFGDSSYCASAVQSRKNIVVRALMVGSAFAVVVSSPMKWYKKALPDHLS